ncbi:MAG: hypothetical protein WDN27_06575 [Candidatus Saccharibacteria bacterium]
MSSIAEKAGWQEDPTPEFVVEFLQGYFARKRHATRTERDPSQAFGQIINKPNTRRRYGRLFTDALVELDMHLRSSGAVLPDKEVPPDPCSGREG